MWGVHLLQETQEEAMLETEEEAMQGTQEETTLGTHNHLNTTTTGVDTVFTPRKGSKGTPFMRTTIRGTGTTRITKLL